jgi:hypothetical protein
MTKLAFVLIFAGAAGAAGAACRSHEPQPSDQAGSQVTSPTGATRATGPAGATSSAGGSADTSAPPAPGEPVGTTDVDRAGHNMTGLRPHQGANCPSQLPGTTTRLLMTPRGVDVSVTSRDPRMVRRIVAVAELHVRGRTADVSRPHDQKHGGPGIVGYCPVLVSDQTHVTMTRGPDGATLHVDARSPDRVAELQQLIKARAVRLPGYVSS